MALADQVIVNFVLSLPELAGGSYVILASASGNSPGLRVGRAGTLALVRDPWFELSLHMAGNALVLPGTRGVLDANGRAEASFIAPPEALLGLVGAELTWAAIAATATSASTTPPVSFAIVP